MNVAQPLSDLAKKAKTHKHPAKHLSKHVNVLTSQDILWLAQHLPQQHIVDLATLLAKDNLNDPRIRAIVEWETCHLKNPASASSSVAYHLFNHFDLELDHPIAQHAHHYVCERVKAKNTIHGSLPPHFSCYIEKLVNHPTGNSGVMLADLATTVHAHVAVMEGPDQVRNDFYRHALVHQEVVLDALMFFLKKKKELPKGWTQWVPMLNSENLTFVVHCAARQGLSSVVDQLLVAGAQCHSQDLFEQYVKGGVNCFDQFPNHILSVSTLKNLGQRLGDGERFCPKFLSQLLDTHSQRPEWISLCNQVVGHATRGHIDRFPQFIEHADPYTLLHSVSRLVEQKAWRNLKTMMNTRPEIVWEAATIKWEEVGPNNQERWERLVRQTQRRALLISLQKELLHCKKKNKSNVKTTR